jgi:hypothetical protein
MRWKHVIQCVRLHFAICPDTSYPFSFDFTVSRCQTQPRCHSIGTARLLGQIFWSKSSFKSIILEFEEGGGVVGQRLALGWLLLMEVQRLTARVNYEGVYTKLFTSRSAFAITLYVS